mgnify:CR=1 FL=1|jgi:hypothetical protein
MNPELLTCRRLTAGVIYPPIPLQPADLNKLYAEITERYPYQSLQHLPDGVRMSNQNNDCFVQNTRIQVNEEVMYFQATKEKVLDIFEMVRSRIGLQQFLTFGVKLTAFLPLQKPGDAVAFIENYAVAIKPDQWDILGPGRKGTGLRIVLHQQGICELKIEPFFNDTSQLYVELDVQYPEPFAGLAGIEEKMDAAYNYMFDNVKNFIASLK